MALASTSPDPPSPLKNLEALYPLACTLVGDEAAPSLLVRVYERVADAPPDERPDTPEDWLALLLREAPEQGQPPGGPEASNPSATPDAGSLRRDTAERLARNTMPVALATCSTAERFVLALNASRLSEAPRSARLPSPFDAPLPTDPSALLREKLRAVLSAPEADLIDETLSDAELQGALRNVLRDHFAPVPSSLRARLRAVLRSSSPTADEEEEDEDAPGANPSAAVDTSGRLLDRLPSRPKPRTLLVVLLMGVLVLGGGLGVSYLTGSSSASSPMPPTLTAFSAGQAGAVTTELATTQPAEAEAYLDSTWGRQVRLPSIANAQLQGVGQLRASGNTEIPVVLYTDDDARIAAFVYSYALVDRLDDTATLDTQVRSQLAQRNQFVADGQTAGPGLLWRDRANIFVVVSPTLSSDTLRARVQP